MQQQGFKYQTEIDTLNAYIEEANGVIEADFENWYLNCKDRVRFFSNKPPTKDEFIKKANCALLMYKKLG